jgi:hypothetical protein
VDALLIPRSWHSGALLMFAGQITSLGPAFVGYQRKQDGNCGLVLPQVQVPTVPSPSLDPQEMLLSWVLTSRREPSASEVKHNGLCPPPQTILPQLFLALAFKASTFLFTLKLWAWARRWRWGLMLFHKQIPGLRLALP